ncbi:MAG: oligosaccharide flippase family protein [Bacillaceae bacterium]|nr:oligosaccharide flippase family protein [Bacillaceae bacterium]
MKYLPKITWAFSGNMFYALTQFLMLSMIAKIGGPIAVGLFTLALAITSPVFLFFNVRLRTVFITDKNNDYTIEEYIKLRQITGYISLFFIIIITLIFYYDFTLILLVVIIAISKYYEMNIDLCYGLYQRKMHFNLVGKSLILRGICNLSLVSSFYLISNNLIISMIGLALSNFILYKFYDSKRANILYNYNLVNNNFVSINKLKALFLFALPLGISTVLGSLNTNLPRYIIEHNLGIYELGIFAGFSYLLVIGNTLLNGISQVFMPVLSNYVKNNNLKGFIRLLKRLILVGGIIGIVMVATFFYLGEYIILAVYSHEYLDYKEVLMILVIGISFLYSSVFLGTAITALQKFKIQPIIHILSLVILIIFSLIFIKQLGLLGMAFAVLIGYVVTSIGYIIVLIKILMKRKFYNEKVV